MHLSISFPRPPVAFLWLLFFCLTGSSWLHAQYETVPSSPRWHPNELLNWSPESDPDAPYNRSRVPLAERFSPPTEDEDAALHALWNVNSHARPGEARVQAVTTFNTIPVGATHGWRTTDVYAPSMWQYTDSMVFWGSSDRDNRTILTPTAHTIDAAHRNGVRIYGKIFYHWNGSPDNESLQRVRDLLQKSGSSFPVADKLIEAALYYGFDGWFINQENYQTNSTDAQNMRDFIAYFRERAEDLDASHLRIIWYDAMAEDGSRSFQNALTTRNDGFMKSGRSVTQPGGLDAAHEMFLNFWWYYNANQLENSRAHALDIGVDPYDVYAGIWTENYRTLGFTPDPNGGGNIEIPWDFLFPEDEPHHHSIALYGAETPFIKGNSPSAVRKQDEIYWSGPNSDPSDTAIASGSPTPNWHGIAHYIPARSSITQLPFVTHFNPGQGERYFINGVRKMSGPWTNLSLQDLLPTWRWIVESDGTKLVPEFDTTDAFYGGASLRVSGTLTGNRPNTLKLYQTQLEVTSETVLQLVYKTGTVETPTLQVGLTFLDDPGNVVYLDSVPASSTSDWSETEFPLEAFADRTIAAISLRFASARTLQEYSANIGRIAIRDGSPVIPAAPSNIVVEATTPHPDDAFAQQVKLKWTPSPDPVLHYNVYYRPTLEDGGEFQRVWLGATPNHYFFAQIVRRTGAEANGYIEVEAVSPSYGASPATSTSEPTITFDPLPNLHHPFIASYPAPDYMILGSGGSFDNHARAFDNDVTTYAEPGGSNGAWVGIALGARNARPVTAIQFIPRANHASRMRDGVFQGSSRADFSSEVVDLARVNATPAEGEWTTLLVDNPDSFAYLRYLSPDGGYGNVAEIKFFGPGDPIPPAPPMAFQGTMVDGTAHLSWSTSPSDLVYGYHLERATSRTGPFARVASHLSHPSYLDPELPDGTQYVYRVIAENDGGEGEPSNLLVLNPANEMKLTGTIIGGGSPSRGTSFEHVFDGDPETVLATIEDPGWVGLDLGVERDVVLTSIRYRPDNSNPNDSAHADLLIGGRFQVSSTLDFSSDVVTLFEVPKAPPYDQFTSSAIPVTERAYRYARYVSADGKVARLSDLEFYGVSRPTAPTGVTVIPENDVATLYWEKVPGALHYQVQRSVTTGGPYETLANTVEGLTYRDSERQADTSYFYIVYAVNEVGESPPSPEAVPADGFVQWLVANGVSPGSGNTGFENDLDGDGSSNGVEYMTPHGLSIVTTADITNFVAIIRSDPDIVTELWTSSDLQVWSPLAFTEAEDQENVPEGFVRIQSLDGLPVSEEPRRFYQLEFRR